MADSRAVQDGHDGFLRRIKSLLTGERRPGFYDDPYWPQSGDDVPPRRGRMLIKNNAQNFTLSQNAAFTPKPPGNRGASDQTTRRGVRRKLSVSAAEEGEDFQGGRSPSPQSDPTPPPLEPVAAPAEGDNDDSWLENWLRNENRWLRDRTEELERQVRRRTITLGSALVATWLIAAAAGLAAMMPRDRPEVEAAAAAGAASPPDAPTAVPAAARTAEWAPSPDAATPPRTQPAARPDGPPPARTAGRQETSAEKPTTGRRIEPQPATDGASGSGIDAPRPAVAAVGGSTKDPEFPRPEPALAPAAPAEVKTSEPASAVAGEETSASTSAVARGETGRASEIGPPAAHRAPSVAPPAGETREPEGRKPEARAKAAGDEALPTARQAQPEPQRRQPEPSPAVAPRNSGAVAAPQDPDARTGEANKGAEQEGAEQEAAVGRATDAEVEGLRAALAATKKLIEGQEAQATRYGPTIIVTPPRAEPGAVQAGTGPSGRGQPGAGPQRSSTEAGNPR